MCVCENERQSKCSDLQYVLSVGQSHRGAQVRDLLSVSLLQLPPQRVQLFLRQTERQESRGKTCVCVWGQKWQERESVTILSHTQLSMKGVCVCVYLVFLKFEGDLSQHFIPLLLSFALRHEAEQRTDTPSEPPKEPRGFNSSWQ